MPTPHSATVSNGCPAQPDLPQLTAHRSPLSIVIPSYSRADLLALCLRSVVRYAPVGTDVLVVDDVLTTGGSVRDVLDAVRERGAEVIGVGMLVDRSGGKVDFGVPFFACLTVDVASFAPEDCQLCKDGVPLKVT